MNIASEMSTAPAWSMALLAWPSLLALELIVGSAALSLIMGFPTHADSATYSECLARTMACWWRLLAIISLFFSLLVLVNTVADMAGVSWAKAFPLIGEVLRQTHVGRIWKWQLPTGLALLLVTWIPLRHFIQELVLLTMCGALLLMGSLSSHAIDHGAAIVAIHFIHQLAAGLWAGSLFAFWRVALQFSAESHVIEAAAAMLSKLAAFSVTVLVATGLLVGYAGLGLSLDHLLHSTYGQILLIKLTVFGLVLGVGAYNRYLILPLIDRLTARQALIRNVCAEWLTIVVVLALAALLANTPPARMSTDMPMPMSGSRVPLVEVKPG